MNKLAILIPSYFRDERLDRLIESSLQLKNTAVYVCFDSLTDPNEQRIKSKYGSQVLTFSKENGGLSHTRNFLFENTDSEYILYVDDDDWIHEEFIEWWNINCESVNMDVYKFKLDFVIDGVVKRTINYKMSGKYLKKSDFLESMQCSTWIIKRDFYKSAGLKFNNGHLLEDESFGDDILLKCKKIVNTNVRSIMHDMDGTDKITRNFTDERINKFLLEIDFLIDNYKKNRYYLTSAMWNIRWLRRTHYSRLSDNAKQMLNMRLDKCKKHKVRIVINSPMYFKFAFIKIFFKKF